MTKFRTRYDTTKVQIGTDYTERAKRLGLKNESMTDQSQMINADLNMMAETFGIDAMKNLAEQKRVSKGSAELLFGHDLTQTIKTREEQLRLSNTIQNLWETIPAGLRRDMFKDNQMNLLNQINGGKIEDYEALNQIGLISDETLNGRRAVLQQEQEKNKLQVEALKFYEQHKNDVLKPSTPQTGGELDVQRP